MQRVHYHIGHKGRVLPFTLEFSTFAWALARCATMMSEDNEVRYPVECEYENVLHKPKERPFHACN